MDICPHCGARIEDGASTCTRCGKPIGAGKTQGRPLSAAGDLSSLRLLAVILVGLAVAAFGILAAFILRDREPQRHGVEADPPSSAAGSDAGTESAELDRIAQAVLGGSVLRAIGFKDKNEIERIVALWSPSERSIGEDQVIVLERFAGNYVKRWSEDVHSVRTEELMRVLGVIDVDGDGYLEIVFPSFDNGAAVESYSLNVYSLKTGEMYQVFAEYSAGSPPHIEFSPDLASAPPEIRKVVEDLAAKGNIVRPVDPRDGGA